MIMFNYNNDNDLPFCCVRNRVKTIDKQQFNLTLLKIEYLLLCLSEVVLSIGGCSSKKKRLFKVYFLSFYLKGKEKEERRSLRFS